MILAGSIRQTEAKIRSGSTRAASSVKEAFNDLNPFFAVDFSLFAKRTLIREVKGNALLSECFLPHF
ncbi:hypothetical protein DXB18_09410 [Clostridium sp. OM02-18AC]|nr:hypothetical protein DXB18_09410 [Clostridium sp. OM02-18AC]